MAEGTLRIVHLTERRLKDTYSLSTFAYAAVMLWSYWVAGSCMIPLEMWLPILLLGFLPKALVHAVVTALRWNYGYAKGNCGAAPWAWHDKAVVITNVAVALMVVLILPMFPGFSVALVFTRFGLHLAAVAVAMLLMIGKLLWLAWQDGRAWRTYVVEEAIAVDFHTYVMLMHVHMVMEG